MVSSAPGVPQEPLPLQVFWVGIGCKRGTSKRMIEQAMRFVFEEHRLSEDAIAGVGTIDTKVNEAGLIDFCRDRSLPLFFYAAERLRSVVVPNASSAIEEAVGTPSVAEAAALLACWEAGGRGEGQITAETQRRGESCPEQISTLHTLHPTPRLYVPKQCYRSAETGGAVTIAVVLEG